MHVTQDVFEHVLRPVKAFAEIARTLKPNVKTVVRTHSDEEADLLRKDNAGEVFVGEHELAQAMTRHVMEQMTLGASRDGTG